MPDFYTKLVEVLHIKMHLGFFIKPTYLKKGVLWVCNMAVIYIYLLSLITHLPGKQDSGRVIGQGVQNLPLSQVFCGAFIITMSKRFSAARD